MNSRLEDILTAIQDALDVAVPLLGDVSAASDIRMAESIAAIIQQAYNAYAVHVGEAYDLSLLTDEPLIP